MSTCERFSLVETCTVSPQRASPAVVTSVSGVAAAKLPPSAKNTSTLPSRIALIESTTSQPCARGGSKPNSSRSLSRNASGTFSQTPIDRSPCTLLCPRTGHGPAPGRPMLPRSSRKFITSRIVSTAFLCWVRPIAQQTITLPAAVTSSVNASICPRVSPLSSSTDAQSSACQAAAAASKPAVWAAMNA